MYSNFFWECWFLTRNVINFDTTQKKVHIIETTIIFLIRLLSKSGLQLASEATFFCESDKFRYELCYILPCILIDLMYDDDECCCRAGTTKSSIDFIST